MYEDGEFQRPPIRKKTTKPHSVFKIILGVILAIAIIISLVRCLYTINEQQNGVVTQFGKVLEVKTAGMYFKFPWQSIKKVDMTTHGTGIGYTVSPEGQNIVNYTDGIMITSDFNLLNIDFYMEYRVTDPVAYLYNSENPEEILRNIALANIRTIVSNYTVDEAMTTGKGQIQSDVKDAISKQLEKQNIGLSIINITIQDSEPPTQEIITAFKEVESAKQKADTAMNQAKQYENQMIPQAEADADAIVKSAEAKKQARIAEGEGDVAKFNEIYEEYQKYPLVTKRRMFLEKMEEILPGLKVVITDGNTQTMLPVEPFSSTSITNNGGVTNESN